MHVALNTVQLCPNELACLYMRTALMLSLGICVIAVSGLVIALMHRRSPLDDLDSVSGQWIAEHRSKLDQ